MELDELLIADWLMAANVLVSAVAIGLGAFVIVAPDQAAKIWGSRRLETSNADRRASFVRWYRVFGLLLLLGGVLFAVDTIVFSKYHR